MEMTNTHPSASTNGTALRLGFTALVISLVGSLPFGTLNVTAFNIGAKQGVDQATWFVIAVVLVELLAVRLTLFGDKLIRPDKKYGMYIIPLAVILLVYLAISSFTAEPTVPGEAASTGIGSPILLGLLLSSLNPLQIPFWLGWNKVLSSRGTLKHELGHYIAYISGIGLGSFTALMAFVIAGRYLFEHYEGYTEITNIVLGLLYLGFALHLVWVFYKKYIKPRTQ